MPEIRGKRVDNGKWIYDNIVFTRSGRAFKLEGSFFTGETHEGNFERGEIYGTEVIPETVGRYSGLTDKNGVKIFEGDIIRTPFFTFVVCFEEGCFGGFFKEDLCEGFCAMMKSIYGVGGEVIGNIHDNPEMMKGETI